MKYKKKPIIIDAILFDDSPKSTQDLCELMNCDSLDISRDNVDDAKIIIHTLEGDMYGSIGDYIIKGVNGEFYPCKPDIFAKSYDKA